MAYRGSSHKGGQGSKRPLPPATDIKSGSGFESNFSELASYSTPPTSKRQRTNTGGKAGGSSRGGGHAHSRISPLKFDTGPKVSPLVRAAPLVSAPPRTFGPRDPCDRGQATGPGIPEPMAPLQYPLYKQSLTGLSPAQYPGSPR